MSLSEQQAIQALNDIGYEVSTATFIPEGRSHDIFRVVTSPPQKLTMIARFEKPQLVPSLDGLRRDFTYNGPLSLRREKELMDLVRNKAQLPAPEVYGLYEDSPVPVLLVEELPGVYFSDYLKRNCPPSDAFLGAFSFLGNDLAKAHSIGFNSFGDVLSADLVHPGHISNFADRIQMISQMKLQRAYQTGVLENSEAEDLHRYITGELATLAKKLGNRTRASLILTDLHSMNFFVDWSGKPSGYFDLEHCQAGLPSLDIYYIRRSLFYQYSDAALQAEEAFLKGYQEGGGIYDPEDPSTQRLEQLLLTDYVVGTATLYYGVVDGLRDNWSNRFKGLALKAAREGKIDYMEVKDVTKAKTSK